MSRFSETSMDSQPVISRIEDIDKERLFKVALNEEKEVNTLLAYYRDRINNFDREREEWLHKLETVKLSKEEEHKTQWELQKRREEIADLQKSMSEAKCALYEERQQILKLVKENDLLKVKELEDKKKLSELLALNEPLEQEVVLYKDLRPETVNRYVKNDLSLNKNKENFEKAIKKSGSTGINLVQTIPRGTSMGGKSVLKTIYMPNEQLSAVSMENENLRKQLDQERALSQEQIIALKEELRMREEETTQRYENDQRVIRELYEKNQKLEKINVETSKDFFHLRLRMNDNEKRLNEENELLRLKNAAIGNKLKIYSKQAELETKVSKELADKRADEYASKYRTQIKQKEEHLYIMKDQYAQVQQIYINRVKELEDNLSRLSEKYQTLEKRRILDIEGFKTDARNLIKRLKKVEENKVRVQQHREQRSELADEVDEDEENEEDDVESVASEELDIIKKQLADLEKKLDKARRTE